MNYYGAPTPLNQMASIQIPEARVLMITPFDKSILQDVEKAIMASDIGVSLTNDGNVIRLVIPQLTDESVLQILLHLHLLSDQQNKHRLHCF